MFSPPTARSGINSGWSVAIDGDTAVVGARGVDIAYVFRPQRRCLDRAGAGPIPSDDFGFQFFGASVAIDGDTIVVGAADDNTPDGGGGAGSAYVFVRGDGGVWTEQAHFFAADGAAYDRFGFSCSISGDTAVVGAFQDDRASVAGTGSAYVFVRSGSDWTPQAHLFAPDSTQYDQFGFKVGISGNTALVSAGQDDLPNGGGVGSAYVFDLSCCSGDSDGDGAVDLSDLATLLSHFAVASGATRSDGDFDADGDVDLVDLAHLLAALGTQRAHDDRNRLLVRESLLVPLMRESSSRACPNVRKLHPRRKRRVSPAEHRLRLSRSQQTI